MIVPLAVAPALQGAAVVAAAAAAAAVLWLPDGRRRSIAILVALVASAAGLATLVGEEVGDQLSGRLPLGLAAAGVGLMGLGIVALVARRHPLAFGLMVVAALPFRVPIGVGDETAYLLVPLYGVIGGGAIAYAAGWLPRRPGHEAVDRRLKLVERALAVVVVLYALQALYSSDLDQAVKNVCFFYVPFAVLFVLMAGMAWSWRAARWIFATVVGLALACAAVGYVEYATGHLLIPNPKVTAANELKPYFRVNSLFFDPNVYGRYLVVAMLPLAAVLLWTRRSRTVWLIAAALAVLWGGVVLSLSQSSFVALIAGLLVVAALRWRPATVGFGAGALAAAALAVLVLAPSSVGIATDSERALDRATSGRLDLTRGGLEMARDRPVWGYGSGSFSTEYRRRERIWAPTAAAESHTIPLTVAAEQGALGLAAYLALVGTGLWLVLGGIRRTLREESRRATVARVSLAAAFCALLVHTLAYAAFLEDPVVWTVLALAAAASAWRPSDDAPPTL